MCHVINLVVQAILHAIGEADNPDITDYYTLNKENPIHHDVENDPEQVEMDQEEFEETEDGAPEVPDPITLEEEEKLKASKSSLSKV